MNQTFNSKEFKKALNYCAEAWAMRKDLFGELHPDTLISAVDVAVCNCELGHVHAGFQIIDDSLKNISRDHPRYEYLKERRRNLQTRFSRPGFRQISKRSR